MEAPSSAVQAWKRDAGLLLCRFFCAVNRQEKTRTVAGFQAPVPLASEQYVVPKRGTDSRNKVLICKDSRSGVYEDTRKRTHWMNRRRRRVPHTSRCTLWRERWPCRWPCRWLSCWCGTAGCAAGCRAGVGPLAVSQAVMAGAEPLAVPLAYPARWWNGFTLGADACAVSSHGFATAGAWVLLGVPVCG